MTTDTIPVPEPARPPASSAGRNAVFKLVGIAVLTLAMIVPLILISSLVDERRGYAARAQESVAQGWGGQQTISGPFVAVPYVVPARQAPDGTVIAAERTGEIVFLARDLKVAAKPVVEERARGIFRIPVYTADISMEGVFARPEARRLPSGATLDWSRARLALGVADVRGLSSDMKLEWADGAPAFDPGTGLQAAPSGVQAAVQLAEQGDTPFRLSLRVRGLGRLAFAPSAENYVATISSAWPHPSFDGAYLPETREVTAEGFSAEWRVSHLARALPQIWDNEAGVSIYGTEFGATFFQPVDFYQLVDRSLKYAILFVGLSFLVFFLVETVTGARVHVVQYLLVGAAQVIFYLLLLALAEQIGFASAYLAAGVACVALTALYAISVLGARRRALAVGAALGVLYALLYTLLNEEDYALLTGATASFLALALTMYLTRRVDWRQQGASALEPPPRPS